MCLLNMVADSVPADGSPENLIVPVFLPVAIIYYVVASAGIIFALVCLFFNIIFRNRKYVDSDSLCTF